MGNPLGFLEGPLESFLVFLNHQGGLTIGWAIIALTIVVRLILLPLFVSQYRSARRMQEVAPLMKEVQKRYKHDKRRQQEEMMKLFQEHRVNPFGSCLPMVFQAPIFIALYFVLRDFTKENPDIEGPLSFMGIIPNVETQFRELGWRAVILAVIYGCSQLLATEVGFATSPQVSETQRRIFRFLPVFIVGGLFLYPNVPAGLILYWLTTNLWTCGQQVVLKRRLGPLQVKDVALLGDPEPAKAAAVAPKPKPKPKSKKSQQGSRNGNAGTGAKGGGSTSSAEQSKGSSSGGNAPSGGSAPSGGESTGSTGGNTSSGTQSKSSSSGGSSRPGQKRRPPKKR